MNKKGTKEFLLTRTSRSLLPQSRSRGANSETNKFFYFVILNLFQDLVQKAVWILKQVQHDKKACENRRKCGSRNREVLGLTFLKAFFSTMRSLLGPKGVCIYSETCTNYSKRTLKTKPFYIAIPKIILRVLSCNPITTLFRKKLT